MSLKDRLDIYNCRVTRENLIKERIETAERLRTLVSCIDSWSRDEDWLDNNWESWNADAEELEITLHEYDLQIEQQEYRIACIERRAAAAAF